MRRIGRLIMVLVSVIIFFIITLVCHADMHIGEGTTVYKNGKLGYVKDGKIVYIKSAKKKNKQGKSEKNKEKMEQSEITEVQGKK